MVGKILLILFVVLVAALLILLLIPVSLRVSYEDGNLRIVVRYASRILYPSAHKEESDDSEESAKEKPKKTSGIAKPNFQQISYSVDVLPGIVVRALRGTVRRIRITPLKFHLLIALSDPADAAVLYGKLHGVLNATLPAIHRAVRIEEQDIQLFPDFTHEEMDCIADVGIRIRPFDVLVVALIAALGIIKWYIGYKKRADKTDTAHGQIKRTTAQADPAA